MKPKPTKPITKTCEAEQFERCVLCGVQTAVEVSTPVQARKQYLTGCGQLCPDCYKKLDSNN